MKNLFSFLLSAALLAPAASFAQTTSNPPNKKNSDKRAVRKQIRQEDRAYQKAASETTVNNPQDTTSGVPLNSQRETDLKNGGADRTGGQSAK